MGDADEGSRRIVAVVHLAMLAVIPLSAGALALVLSTPTRAAWDTASRLADAGP